MTIKEYKILTEALEGLQERLETSLEDYKSSVLKTIEETSFRLNRFRDEMKSLTKQNEPKN